MPKRRAQLRTARELAVVAQSAYLRFPCQYLNPRIIAWTVYEPKASNRTSLILAAMAVSVSVEESEQCGEMQPA
jgi:hypothetical protein